MALYSLSIDAIALVAATAKSLFELATPSTRRAIFIEWWVEFDGVTASAVPVKVEWGPFSAAVTTATTLAGLAMRGDPASLCTTKHTTSTEGAGTVTAGAENHRISPTSGLLKQDPLGREWIVPISSFWRLRCTAAAGVNATFGVKWEE